MSPTRFFAGVVVSTVVVFALSSMAANAQEKENENYNFRLTITNDSNVTMKFTVRWAGKAAQEVTLKAAESKRFDTKVTATVSKAGGPKMTVTWIPAKGIEEENMELTSSRLNTSSTNSGKTYIFQSEKTNKGEGVYLKAK